MKPRYESLELKILRSLNVRMNLAAKEENYYLNLEKGYKGEQKFDEWIKPLSNDRLVLNDLLLEYNNTLFQIDSLTISSNTIYLFEVKNYEGDFFIEGDRWYSISRTEIKNPLLQLQRNESLFRRLLEDLGFNISIESYLIFVNPEFHLYQTPLNLPIIFPTQLNRFMDKMKKRPSNLKETHSKLAKQLLSLHLKETPYNRLPKYHYDQLEKGMTCPSCHTFYNHLKKTTLICSNCGGREEYESAVLRNVEEFKLLFPKSKITISGIYEWCNTIKDKKTIRNVLTNNFILIRRGKSSHYVNND
jgi:hypothetical protein